MEETNWFVSLITNPFAKGLVLGIIFCIIIYIRGFLRRRELSKEVDRLRAHLHTKLEIDSSENERRKVELDRLKQERDNLRITVAVPQPETREKRNTPIFRLSDSAGYHV